MKEDMSVNVVSVILAELVKRKQIWVAMEKEKVKWTWLIFISLALFLYHLYDMTIDHYVFHTILDKSYMTVVFIIIGVSYIQISYFIKKCKKAEQQFEELRIDIIERNTELWEKDEYWKQREAIFARMKEKYDINLYHK